MGGGSSIIRYPNGPFEPTGKQTKKIDYKSNQKRSAKLVKATAKPGKINATPAETIIKPAESDRKISQNDQQGNQPKRSEHIVANKPVKTISQTSQNDHDIKSCNH